MPALQEPHVPRRLNALWILTGAMALASPLPASERWPPPGSPEFCVAAQKFLATTGMRGANTLFTDMPSYRHSKPFVKPLRIYQVVTYRGTLPIVVSCKVKTAAHLRAAYGAKAAGEQRFCPALERALQAQAVAELRAANQAAAAAKAAAFVIDAREPYLTGQAYLADFQASYRSADGAVHINPPGLYENYDSWITSFLPERFQGQSYCHLATVEYLKALARGEMAPGTTVTTGEDAPVRPQPR
jgi:hypothetical protein